MQHKRSSSADMEEISVLFHASSIGRTDVVQNAIGALRSSGASEQELLTLISTGRPEDDATPLHLAAAAGHSDVIRYLLNSNADLNVKPARGDVFLHKKPYDVATDVGKQAFHVYMFEQIAMGRVEAIVRLLQGGIPVSIRDGFDLNETTLHWAASFNNVEVAKLLLLNGIDVNVTNVDGQTPLFFACKAMNIDMLLLLLLEGASVTSMDVKGKLPKDWMPKEHDNMMMLLDNPPAPTFVLRNAFLASEELAAANALAAREQEEGEGDIGYLLEEDADNDDEEEDEYHLFRSLDAEEGADKDPLLVLWPPAQRQVRRGLAPFVMHSAESLLICVASETMDVFPLLSWSGLMDALDRFNLVPQVKRATITSSTNAKIRFCVDQNICPGRHRYELQVTAERVYLAASDNVGLLYGIYSFIQLVQLHSQIKVYGDGVTAVEVPPVCLTDWPDMPQRAVMWSYRHGAQAAFAQMRENVELFSRLRLNVLLLVIDASSVEEYTQAEQDAKQRELSSGLMENDKNENSTIGGVSVATATVTVRTEEMEHEPPTAISALDEICTNLCVELVPTIIINSVYERLPLITLKAFSHSAITIIFTFDLRSTRMAVAENDQSSVPSSSSVGGGDGVCEMECKRCIEAAMDAALASGFTSVTCASSEWTRFIASPLTAATHRGLNTVERSLDQLCPSSLYLKPVYCAQDFIKSLYLANKRCYEDGLSMTVLPAFMDHAFLFPTLLLKYYCLVHAGFAWNTSTIVDMLQIQTSEDGLEHTPPVDAAILREVVSLLLLTKSATSDPPTDRHTALLTVFAGDVMAPPPVPIGAVPEAISIAAPLSENPSAIARTEKLLWSILNAQISLHDTDAPSKSDASLCLKYYRRLLANARWTVNNHSKASGLLMDFAGFSASSKVEETPFDIEVDEYFSVAHLLSVLCRAIVLAYNAWEKKSGPGYVESPLPLGTLLRTLAPGTKSDIANALLAGLDHCASSAKRRFDKLLVVCPTMLASSVPTKRGTDPARLGRASFLRQTQPGLPGMVLAEPISDRTQIEANIKAMFI